MNTACRRLLAVAALVLAAVAPAFGIMLGEPEIRSLLGEPLRVWIPYTLANGELLDASCVRVSPGTAVGPHDIPAVMNARPRLQSQAGGNYIVLESAQPFNDPAARLTVGVQCGTAVAVTREHVLLLDPPRLTAVPASRVADAAPVAAPVRAVRSKTDSVAVRAPAAAREPAGTAKPALPAQPAPVEENVAVAASPCCFRLAYELNDIAAPSAEERERLRQQMRDRMSDEDPVMRLQAARAELATLKAQLMAPAPVRNEQTTQHARALREYVLGAVYLLVALALAVAAVQWIRMKRRRKLLELRTVRSSVHAQPRAAAKEVAEPITLLGADVMAAHAADLARGASSPPGAGDSPSLSNVVSLIPSQRASDHKKATGLS